MPKPAHAPIPKADHLALLAAGIARRTPGFTEIRGEGEGNRATNLFMRQLKEVAEQEFGAGCSEAKLCGTNKLALDFYFRDEATAVEIAFGLRNPNSEYERDVFKCLMAMDRGCAVRRLLFVSKPGAIKRQSAPGQKAITEFVRKRFGLAIEIYEIDGTPEDETRGCTG